MKNAPATVGKILGFCAVVYALSLLRNPELRPDLKPVVRALGESVSGLYPEVETKQGEAQENAERVQRLVHELPQTPRN